MVPTLVADETTVSGGLAGSHLPHYRGDPIKEFALSCLRGPLAALPGNYAQGNLMAQGGPTLGTHSLPTPKLTAPSDFRNEPSLFALNKVSLRQKEKEEGRKEGRKFSRHVLCVLGWDMR